MPVIGMLTRAMRIDPRSTAAWTAPTRHRTGRPSRKSGRNSRAVAPCRATSSEGTSHSDPKMRPFKTGSARMALGAASMKSRAAGGDRARRPLLHRQGHLPLVCRTLLRRTDHGRLRTARPRRRTDARKCARPHGAACRMHSQRSRSRPTRKKRAAPGHADLNESSRRWKGPGTQDRDLKQAVRVAPAIASRLHGVAAADAGTDRRSRADGRSLRRRTRRGRDGAREHAGVTTDRGNGREECIARRCHAAAARTARRHRDGDPLSGLQDHRAADHPCRKGRTRRHRDRKDPGGRSGLSDHLVRDCMVGVAQVGAGARGACLPRLPDLRLRRCSSWNSWTGWSDRREGSRCACCAREPSGDWTCSDAGSGKRSLRSTSK